jgi:hypothetical protein
LRCWGAESISEITVARPCRLRRCFISAPASCRLRPHGRATPSCRCVAHGSGSTHSHRVSGLAPALARAWCVIVAHLVLASGQGPVRSIVQAPSAAIISSAPCPAPCTLRQWHWGWRRLSRAPGARRVTLHRGSSSRSRWPPGPQGRAAENASVNLCGRRWPAVAASGKAATATHGSRREHRAERSGARMIAGIEPDRPRARRHALSAFPPAASFPPGPPNLGTPLRSLCSLKRNPQGGRTLCSAGDLSGRGRPPPAALGGTARDHGPRSRPSNPSPCHHHGSCGVQIDGPGWRVAGITAWPMARRWRREFPPRRLARTVGSSHPARVPPRAWRLAALAARTRRSAAPPRAGPRTRVTARARRQLRRWLAGHGRAARLAGEGTGRATGNPGQLLPLAASAGRLVASADRRHPRSD